MKGDPTKPGVTPKRGKLRSVQVFSEDITRHYLEVSGKRGYKLTPKRKRVLKQAHTLFNNDPEFLKEIIAKWWGSSISEFNRDRGFDGLCEYILHKKSDWELGIEGHWDRMVFWCKKLNIEIALTPEDEEAIYGRKEDPVRQSNQTRFL